MTAKKEISRSPAGKKDGKTGLSDQLANGKTTAKYTFERTKEDLETIKKLRKHLQNNQCSSWKSYNSCNVSSSNLIVFAITIFVSLLFFLQLR